MKILVVSSHPATQERWVEPISNAIPEAEVALWHPDLPPQNADIAVVWSPPAELFERERNLRAVFNLGAGVDGLLKLPTLSADTPIVRLEDAGMAVQMAEYAVWAITRASRQFDDYVAQQQAGVWATLSELRRAQWPVGVLGAGVMGSKVAQTLAALDYPVAGWSRSGKVPAGVESFAGLDQLPAFLARSRVLINTLPLTAETRDILRRETLEQLMPQAHIINMGRGEHLVEEDLLALLDAGHIERATLDVFRQEPLPKDHPFWKHPKVTITPHVAAISLQHETVAQIINKIQRLMRGEPLSGVVQRDRGY
ncbi:glyoxylate/hydroxypyruvate reductase A [Bordetella sp. 15P40C-2]|uniref:2-hydroxyacid dehydrogenase n=1 Tax=Bordetella sp. 15P40C-2 TaxID=2572246 RepID=UPI00132C3730|nr:glyoxylate/hydroxypyruvate reductase A [Bordetella sp. 15P40C-2]MVW70773.1 glyoxylate/hydroxypyruvate reductase A [Bordetella sp. 15P40C-2]